MIFAAITMFRCRPRPGLFAAFNWGTAIKVPAKSSTNTEQSSETSSDDNPVL